MAPPDELAQQLDLGCPERIADGVQMRGLLLQAVRSPRPGDGAPSASLVIRDDSETRTREGLQPSAARAAGGLGAMKAAHPASSEVRTRARLTGTRDGQREREQPAGLATRTARCTGDTSRLLTGSAAWPAPASG